MVLGCASDILHAASFNLQANMKCEVGLFLPVRDEPLETVCAFRVVSSRVVGEGTRIMAQTGTGGFSSFVLFFFFLS